MVYYIEYFSDTDQVKMFYENESYFVVGTTTSSRAVS